MGTESEDEGERACTRSMPVFPQHLLCRVAHPVSKSFDVG